MLQRTEVQKKCAGNEVVRSDQTCISRDHRDTLWISWNFGCKLVCYCQNVQVHVLHSSVEDSNLGSCINDPTEIRDGRTVPKEHVLYQSLLLQHHPAVPQNDTNVSSCHTQQELCFRARAPGQISCPSSQDKRTKSEPRRRRHHDSPPPEQQEFVSLPIASFANQAVQTNALSDTFMCRQLHHRRLLLLEFLLQTTILPHVSDDSNARIRETCVVLFLATTRRLR